MKTAHQLLKDDGLLLLHTVGRNNSAVTCDQWINKYIFPNSTVPSIRQIGSSIDDLFVMEDWHRFGEYYDRTLLAWF